MKKEETTPHQEKATIKTNHTKAENIALSLIRENFNRPDIQYAIAEIVYLKTDMAQDPYMVTGIDIRQSGIIYQLTSGTYTTPAFSIEITREKTIY